MDLEAQRMQQIVSIGKKLTDLRKMNERDDLSDDFKFINDQVMTDLAQQKISILNKIVIDRRKMYGR
ncbi:MAG: hypothetical protein ACTSQF_01955 [Candidatus Heimdallarchaeaceae archaeon]